MRGNITAWFYSPHPSPLQQERELMATVIHCFIVNNSCVDTCARRERE